MPVLKQPLRFAHSEGHTDLCYDSSGRFMLTCGTEGDVRVWEGIDDDDAVSHRAGDKVYAIAFGNNRFYTASETNSVDAHLFPDGSPDGVVTRFTVHVTHIVLNSSGTKLVAGSSDFTIKVVNTQTHEQKVFQGHDAPILSVALDPKEKYLASSSCDGTVRIWDLETEACVKTITAIPKSNDYSSSTTLCRLEWHPDRGKSLAVPLDKEVRIYERDTWDNLRFYSNATVKEPVSIATFSPCGKYLAAGCRDGFMYVWNYNTKTCLLQEKHEKNLPICALKWNPNGKHELAYCDTEGQLGVMENVVTTEEDEQDDALSAAQYASLFADDDDDDDALMHASNMETGPALGDDDDDDDDDDFDSLEKLKKRIMGEDNDNSQGIDGISKMADKDNDLDSMTGGVKPTAQVKSEGYRPTALQRPFQSGSSPVHLSQRFMVWNSVGIIRQYSTDEENSIDIEFHDTATHHAMHMANDLGHTVADISNEAVVLACEADEGSPSKLVCLHFSSWDNSKEWSIEMPKGEDIQSVALGQGWVAVATDKRNVRIFTIGGIQKHILSIPGPVVTLAAHGATLCIIYHLCHGLPGDQCLSVKWVTMNGMRQAGLRDGSLPLSPKSTLTWIGYSFEGTPFSMDSSGIVRMLNRKFGPSWIPVANTKDHVKGKSDAVWMVGVLEHPQQLRCIPCKGSQYPPVLPRPALSILPFQIPVCEIYTEKGQFEEGYLRSEVFSQHISYNDGMYDEDRKNSVTVAERECLMKLFALACKTDREFRAVEICQMMPDPQTVQLAIKYASRLKLISLAERLNEVVRRKHEEEMARVMGSHQIEEEEEIPMQTNYSSYYNASESTNHGPPQEEVQSPDLYEEEDSNHLNSGPTLLLKSKKEPEEETPRCLSSQSQTRKNPFKVQKASDITPTSSRGSSVFDSLTKSKKQGAKTPFGRCPDVADTKKTSSKKVSHQARLFSPKEREAGSTPAENNTQVTAPPEKKVVSAFQLWFDDSRSSLEEEHPEVDEEELTKLAAQAFRQIPKEERKEWMEKAKVINSGGGDEEETKKRKRDKNLENEDNNNHENGNMEETSHISPVKKKPMTGKTKLASFAFSKN